MDPSISLDVAKNYAIWKLELWSLLTTSRKSYMDFSMNPFLYPYRMTLSDRKPRPVLH